MKGKGPLLKDLISKKIPSKLFLSEIIIRRSEKHWGLAHGTIRHSAIFVCKYRILGKVSLIHSRLFTCNTENWRL